MYVKYFNPSAKIEGGIKFGVVFYASNQLCFLFPEMANLESPGGKFLMLLVIPGKTNDALGHTSWCMEAIEFQVRNKEASAEPGKTEWIWVWGSSGSHILPSLVLDGVALPQTCAIWGLLLVCLRNKKQQS